MPILGIDASRAVKKDKTGVEWYSWHLLQAMGRCTPEDWKVRLYVPEAIQNSEFRIQNFDVRVLRWPGRGWTQGRLSLEMMMRPPDVLFVPSHVIPLIHPEHTVTTVHDVVFLKHPELYDPQDLEDQKRGLEFALRFARKIIVPSKATREEVMAAGAKGDQVVVVPHGVSAETGNWKLETGIARDSKFLISNFKFPYILFIGRLERKKNVLGLIHAFRRMVDDCAPTPPSHPPSPPLGQGGKPSGRGGNETVSPPLGGGVRGGEDLKLILAGPLGYGGEDVLQAIKTFKLADYVVHLGYVDRAQYRTLLHNAAMLVFPSFGEGFGFPVLEAMDYGTPVVCSDIPVLHEVGGNAAQYVNPRDPEDIARGIETVLKNEMLASEMVRRGKELAQQFTWEKTAKETWNVICNTTGP